MKKRLFLGLVVIALLGLLPFPLAAETSVPSRSVVVRIEFATPEQLQGLAARYDVWEVNHDEGYVVAFLRPAEYAALEAAGYRMEIDEARSATPDTIPGFPCYRTITEYQADLDTIAADHPAIVQLKTIGTSYEGRTMKVARLTNRAIAGNKPILYVVANIHGRELMTPEIAMQFIETLTGNYGPDPNITWVLDHHEVHVLVSINPDGHVKNEEGQPWAYWRKNTHPYGSCSDDSIGVDLNRNHSFKWGCCGGSSDYPCDEIYRGPTAVSESETQAVQAYARSLFPDQRGPGDGDPAPESATGVLITLHQYSNLVLWPWGWTGTAAPNVTGLEALGRKLATYNGYTPQQSSQLYITDGSTDDWSYGELGIASYTFEVGSNGDGFYPPCSRYDALVWPNVDALIYAAKVARTPYMTSRGPDALSVVANPNDPMGGVPIQLTATINDDNNGDNNISAAEYYVDTPPWAGGTATAMQAVDGAFDEKIEPVQATVPTTGWSEGRHTLFVRGRDSLGYWGPPTAVYATVSVDSNIAGQVSVAGSGAPIVGAAVNFDGMAKTYEATTDSTGYYQVPVFSGEYTGTATAFGYYPQTVVNIVAVSGQTTTQDFALAALPTGMLRGSVRELGSNAPLAADLTVEDTPARATADPAGDYELELPVGTYTVTASAAGHASRTVTAVQVAAGQDTVVDFLLPLPPCVLLVDDDYAGTTLPHLYETYYTPVLDTLGIDYDTWQVQTDDYPTVDDLAGYEAVLWLTGDVRYNTLNLSEQNALRPYLQGGGGLFLTGQNIAWDIAADSEDFLGTMLKASYVADDANGSDTTTDVVGAGLFAGQDLVLGGGDGADNQDSPDVIAALSGGAPAFTYPLDTTAAVSADPGAYRSIFLAFGLEGAADAADRQEVLRSGLEWLGCSPVPVDLVVHLTAPGTVHPGDLLVYTLTVRNNSTIPLTGLSVADTLPPQLGFVSADPAAAFSGGEVRWTGLALDPEATLTLLLTTRVGASVPDGTVIHNADYEADAVQLPMPVPGQGAADTLVRSSPWVQYMPVVLKNP